MRETAPPHRFGIFFADRILITGSESYGNSRWPFGKPRTNMPSETVAGAVQPTRLCRLDDRHRSDRGADRSDPLIRYVADFPRRRVLVLGDAILDEYLLGDCSRISPEAPVPVLRVRTDKQELGGAANT